MLEAEWPHLGPTDNGPPLRGTNSYHVITWCHYSHPGTAGLKFWPESTRVRVPGDILDLSRICEPMTSLPACPDSFSRLGFLRLWEMEDDDVFIPTECHHQSI